MTLRGNPQRLRDLSKSLGDLPQVAKIQIAKRGAEAITGLALASFDAGQTPFGDEWPPSREGRDVDLVDSGALRATLRFISIGGRMRAVLGVKHARYQVGKRRVLPAPGQTMPASWRGALADITADVVSTHLRKVA